MRANRRARWPWAFTAAVALYATWAIAARPRCPTWAQCWEADAACERTPKGDWKPCRSAVRRCFERWQRCGGAR